MNFVDFEPHNLISHLYTGSTIDKTTCTPAAKIIHIVAA